MLDSHVSGCRCLHICYARCRLEASVVVLSCSKSSRNRKKVHIFYIRVSIEQLSLLLIFYFNQNNWYKSNKCVFSVINLAN